MKLISVIVAAYNIEQYLPECLDSLLAQTYEPLQIIVVDDGSTDGTAGICDDYGARSEKITVLHQENRGLAAARNAGLKLAKGDYIGYVDGDDWVEPDMYESMLRALKETGAQIAVCAYREVGDGIAETCYTGKQIELTRQEALEIYINDHLGYHIYNSVWSKLFHRKVVNDLLFPEGRKSEDIMYTTRALVEAEKCVFLDVPYYNYRVNRNASIMNTNLQERRFGDEIPFWREQIRYLEEQEMEELSRKAAYQFYRRMLFYYIDFKKKKMKLAAGKLIEMLRGEKTEIDRIYQNEFVKTGDKLRMKLALKLPAGYYLAVQMYDALIIPLRR